MGAMLFRNRCAEHRGHGPLLRNIGPDRGHGPLLPSPVTRIP